MNDPGAAVDFAKLAAAISAFAGGRRAALVTDSNVDRLYGDRFARRLEDAGVAVERIVFAAGERSKTLDTYGELVRGFAALGITRTDFAVALGGGVTGDLAGFAAATYMRGVDFVQTPTTLLAMVDSSIGGKTGVDVPEGKNLVGAFHLPKLILRDTGFLETLPEKEMMNGFAEMIKTAVLFDRGMFDELRALADLPPAGRLARLAPLVERCARWKERVVAADFREGGRRKLLNLGHTFGHAIEKVSDFSVPHGEAVARGMRLVGKDVPEIGWILDAYGFGRYDGSDRAAVLDAVTRDKKRSGDSITLIVPRRVGECELVETPMAEVGKWLP
ncbi:MAG: 3-dehydroquinate synthase [Kiritimatiellae bacterium]|nr:3-dehydroquinate synthase [Kiritimatiellia bacterium]